jgi:hypothetical protein
MDNLIEQPINKEIFRHYWYSQNVCLFEIIKLAQHKEMVFLDKNHEMMPVRCMFPFKVDHLKGQENSLFSKYYFFNSFSYNMYLSCAYYDNPPLFSFNAKDRREQMDRWTKEEQYKNFWSGYDMFFDFDSQKQDDIADAWQDAAKLKAVLDQYQVPFTIGFSGSKGFHFRIYYKYLPQNLGINIVTFCKLFAEQLKAKLDLKTLDIGVFDDRRVFKAPYSFDRGNICLPLDDEQFTNFDVRRMAVKQVLDKVKIFNRGDLMRHSNFGYETQRQHFLEFFKAVRA